ncbi:hypothetical protein [Halorussus caseinilyticus]|uniref:Right handed beta helix domain-containing protein n=1 Tax=Halorussus caseinilyticus TaxID=3034025 RepID=A0ABD5WM79_9EURY
MKSVNPGPNGNGIVYIGSFNSNIVDSYFDQAAFVKNVPRSKDTNSLRFHNVTFNTNSSTCPPVVVFSQGLRVTNALFNGVDGPSLNDGLAVVSSDASGKLGILGSDSRVDSSDVAGGTNRMQVTASAFVTGGSNVNVFNGVSKSQFSGCRFSSSGRAFNDIHHCSISNCSFRGTGREAIYRSGSTGGAVSTITGCTFKDFGSNAGEPAIRFDSSQGHRVVVANNAFRSTNGSANDIVLENNARRIVVTGNWARDGIEATVGSATIGEPRFVAPKVVGNSTNPVGFSRATPVLPSGTGSANATANRNAQGAWVYHEGGSGVTINSFGTTTTLNTDPSPVFVPRAGEIWFESSAPSAWDWWWV